jgi:hypothetical protein
MLFNAQVCTPQDGGADVLGGSGDGASPGETSTSDDASPIDDASPSEEGNEGGSQPQDAGAEGPTND